MDYINELKKIDDKGIKAWSEILAKLSKTGMVPIGGSNDRYNSQEGNLQYA